MISEYVIKIYFSSLFNSLCFTHTQHLWLWFWFCFCQIFVPGHKQADDDDDEKFEEELDFYNS